MVYSKEEPPLARDTVYSLAKCTEEHTVIVFTLENNTRNSASFAYSIEMAEDNHLLPLVVTQEQDDAIRAYFTHFDWELKLASRSEVVAWLEEEGARSFQAA